MSFDFYKRVIGGTSDTTFNFGRKFVINGLGGVEPTYIDVILSGVSPLTLTNAKANDLNYVKAFGATEQTNVPKGYTQVEYIESDGTGGYIDTGIVVNSFDYSVEVDFKFEGVIAGGSPRMFWGFMGPNNNQPRWGIGVYSSKWLGSLNATTATGAADENRHTAILSIGIENDTEFYSGTIDGGVLYPQTTASFDTRLIENDLSIYLFARNNNNTAGNFVSGKIYGFKVTKAGVLVNNYIPCKNSNNEVGFYDLVNNTFIGVTGGTLTAGSTTIKPTPENPVDIWCNNGAIKVNQQGQIYTDGTVETITDSVGNTATAEMLLGLDGYQDVQSILDGAITRNVGIKILDGTENWTISSGNYNFYRLNSAVNYLGNLASDFYCTHFEPVTVASSSNNQGIRIYNSAIFLRYDDLYTATSENLPLFKQYLADQYLNGTPVILVYPLAKPTTESVAGQTLSTKSGTNTITATGSLENLELEVSFKQLI